MHPFRFRFTKIYVDFSQISTSLNGMVQGHESVHGGWYLVSVTSSPAQVQDAIRACKEALASLKGAFGRYVFLHFTLFAIVSINSCIFAGVMGDSVQSAKRTILNKFRSDSSKKIALHYGRLAFVSSLILIRLEYVLGGESLWHAD